MSSAATGLVDQEFYIESTGSALECFLSGRHTTSPIDQFQPENSTTCRFANPMETSVSPRAFRRRFGP